MTTTKSPHCIVIEGDPPTIINYYISENMFGVVECHMKFSFFPELHETIVWPEENISYPSPEKQITIKTHSSSSQTWFARSTNTLHVSLLSPSSEWFTMSFKSKEDARGFVARLQELVNDTLERNMNVERAEG